MVTQNARNLWNHRFARKIKLNINNRAPKPCTSCSHKTLADILPQRMEKTSIEINYIQTMCWFNNTIVDIACAGKMYHLNGKVEEKYTYHFGSNFNSSIISENGIYAFIYNKTGTKGLLLKNGELLREINRSY